MNDSPPRTVNCLSSPVNCLPSRTVNDRHAQPDAHQLRYSRRR